MNKIEFKFELGMEYDGEFAKLVPYNEQDFFVYWLSIDLWTPKRYFTVEVTTKIIEDEHSR